MAGGIAVADGSDFPPDPSISNFTRLCVRGTRRPCLSATVTVTKQRSLPSPRISAAVRREQQFGRLSRLVLTTSCRPLLAFAVGDDLEFAGLIDHVIPAQAILEPALSSSVPATCR